MSLPFLHTAPERTSATRWSAVGIFLPVNVFTIAPSLGAGLLMASPRHQEAKIALAARVAAAAQTADVELRGDFERFRQILLTSAQNPSLVGILRDKQHAALYKADVDRSLLNLTA